MNPKGKQTAAEGRPLRAFIYARTSSDDSDLSRSQSISGVDDSRKQSTEVQARECREICKRHGYTVVPASKDNDAFEEKDFSGRTYPTGFEPDAATDRAFKRYFKDHIGRENKRYRPLFGQLLNRLKEVDIIVVRDISRLARPTRYSNLGNFLLQILSEHGVKVHSIAEGMVDPDNPGSRIVTVLQMMISDDSKRTELEKSIAGLKQKRDTGWLTTGVGFYGFESAGHQKMKPIPDQLEVVRFVFKRFLEGTSILQIARELNDQHRKPTAKNSRWTNKPVRNILGRPAYAGLARNSAGRLIESRVFKPHAVISESDFLAVARQLKTEDAYLVETDHSAAKRKDRASKTGKRQGGRPMGSSDQRGPCHPFSGLMRCGHCGKHLYITHLKSHLYDPPVSTYYYQCNSFLFSKSPDFDECRRIRLLESYPAAALAQTKNPAGHGLIEALFPILFVAYIKKYVDEASTDKDLEKERLAVEQKIAELQEEERTLTNTFLPALKKGDAYAQEQYQSIMAERRAEMKALKEQHMAIMEQQSGADIGTISVPSDYFTEPGKIPLETLRALAHQVIETITVYPMKIRVTFKDRTSLELERVRNRNSRLLPFWRAVVDTAGINAKTKLVVSYFYKSTQLGIMTPITTQHKSANLEVLTVGNNDSVDVKRSEILRDPSPFARLLEPLAKVRPTHKRALHFTSSAFFVQGSTSRSQNRPL